jgi:hypothetical protein
MADQGYPQDYPEAEEDADKAPEEDEEKGDDPGMSSKFAKKVVNELYERYNTLRERKSAYKDLVIFLIYVSLNLSILYLQRDATNAYAVVSTIRSTNVIPEVEESTSVQYIYDWLQGTLDEHWVDAKCGDDKCEAPFEFAFYGRFGCKPDCGSFEDVQQVTPVQVDMYFDFKHPAGSTPATTLMQAVQWNLCPTEDSEIFESLNDDAADVLDTTYIAGCYWDEDQVQSEGVFSKLSGHKATIISDVPDGEWQVYIKGDDFNKVSGAVRDRNKLVEHATDLKYNHLAQAVAAYELRQEWLILNQSLHEMNMPEADILKAAVTEIFELEKESLLQQNASGTINGTAYDAAVAKLEQDYEYTEAIAWTSSLLQCKALVETNQTLQLGDWTDDTNTTAYCGYESYFFGADSSSPDTAPLWTKEYSVTVGPGYAESCAAGGNGNFTYDAFCAWAEVNLVEHAQAIKDRLLAMRATMATESGKLYNTIMGEDYYESTNLALVYEISESTGKNMAQPDAVAASYVIDVLMDSYYETSPIELIGALSDYNFANWDWPLFGIPSESFTIMKNSIKNRTDEFDLELEAEASRTYNYGMDEATMLAAIVANDKNSSAYTLVEWEQGPSFGRNAYKTCDMYNRAQEYLGVCVPYAQMEDLAKMDAIINKADQKQTACNDICYCPDCTPVQGETVCACYQCGMDQDWMAEALSPPPSEGEGRRRLLQDDTVEMYEKLLTEIRSSCW